MPIHNHQNTSSATATQSPHSHRLQSSSNYSTNCNGLARGGDSNNGGYYQVGGVANNNGDEIYCSKAGNGRDYVESATPEITVTTSVDITNAGEGNPHNNMPPYLAVYMWKRIG